MDTRNSLEHQLHCVEIELKDAKNSTDVAEKLLEDQKKHIEEMKRQSKNKLLDMEEIIKSIQLEMDKMASKYEKTKVEKGSLKKTLNEMAKELACAMEKTEDDSEEEEDFTKTKTTQQNRKKLVARNKYQTPQNSSEGRSLRSKMRAQGVERNEPSSSRNGKTVQISDNAELEEESNTDLQQRRQLRTRGV